MMNKLKQLPPGLHFLISGIIGTLILWLLSLVQLNAGAPESGEYYFSSFFRNQYTWLAVVCFIFCGFIATYILQWNPWMTGIGLITVFPVVSILEAAFYKGSHNLIGIEIIVYGIWALPGIIAAFIGKYFYKRKMSKKQI